MSSNARILWVTLVSFVLAAVLLLPGWTGEDARENTLRTRQYTRIVNSLMIPWLSLSDPPAQSAGDESASLPREIRWTPPQDAASAGIANAFFRKSFLSEDIRRFNVPRTADDKRLFDIDRGELRGINENAHTFRTPYSTPGRWTGRLYYSTGTPTTNLTLQSLTPDSQAVSIPLSRGKNDPDLATVRVDLFRPRHGQIEGSAVNFYAPAREREVPGVLIAEAWRLGEGLVFQLRDGMDNADVAVAIDGRNLPSGDRFLHIVGADSVLTFIDDTRKGTPTWRKHGWILRSSATTTQDVLYDGETSFWHNTSRNPLIPRVSDVFSSIAASQGSVVTKSVTLSLVRSAEEKAASILKESARNVPKGTVEAPSAITLLDVMSGELIAIPSRPLPQEPASEKELPSFPPNYNFQRLAVGSVAKVLVGAPLLAADPQLIGLKTKGPPGNLLSGKPPKFQTVAGIQVAPTADFHPEGHNFREGIAISSNRFAATLLMLGTHDKRFPEVKPDEGRSIRPTQDQFWLGTKLYKTRPPNLAFEPLMKGSLDLRGIEWADFIHRMYGVRTSGQQAAEENEGSRRYVWAQRPRELRGNDDLEVMFDSISPEYENFRLETIKDKKGDISGRFISLILGGGESRWTNVEVAEAFGSILLRKRVHATLISASDESRTEPVTDETADEAWLQLNREVHAELLEAMRAVVTYSRGTGVKLGRALNQLENAACDGSNDKEMFVLFAKTGTPELEESFPAPAELIFKRMAADGVFEKEDETGFVFYTRKAEKTPLEDEDLTDLRRLARRGGPVAEDFRKYFENPPPDLRASARNCGLSQDPWALWDDVMDGIVVTNNRKMYRGSRIVDGSGKSLYTGATCPKQHRGQNGTFGRHIAFVAAVYDENAMKPGQKWSCRDRKLQIDYTRPNRAVAGVVAFTDPRMAGTAMAATSTLLLEPVADRLKLKIVNKSAARKRKR
jgi:hypothetical protein